MKDKALEALQELLEDTETIVDDSTLIIWQKPAINTIIRIYGEDSEQYHQIVELVPEDEEYDGISDADFDDDFDEEDDIPIIKKEAQELIKSFIKDINRFGMPTLLNHQNDGNFHINITNSQNQETKVNLQFFIEAIRDELTGSQQREVQQIIDEPEIDTPTKKSRIIQKLKSFGEDVATNIVANILTNPGLYGG